MPRARLHIPLAPSNVIATTRLCTTTSAVSGTWSRVLAPLPVSFLFSSSSEVLIPSSEDVNCLYDRLHQEWRHLRDLSALVNHQATRVESTRRFLSAYLQTLKKNNNPIVDEMVDPDVLRSLMKQHPGAVYEQLCAVAPLPTYFGVEFGELGSPFEPTPRSENVPAPSGPNRASEPTTPTPSSVQPAVLSFGSLSQRYNKFAPPPTFGSLFNTPPGGS